MKQLILISLAAFESRAVCTLQFGYFEVRSAGVSFLPFLLLFYICFTFLLYRSFAFLIEFAVC